MKFGRLFFKKQSQHKAHLLGIFLNRSVASHMAFISGWGLLSCHGDVSLVIIKDGL